jgi:hypothetical protein
VLEEGDLLLADPALDQALDLGVVELLGGDAERRLGRLGVGQGTAARQRTVLVAQLELAGRRRDPAQQLLAVGDAAPAEMVDHLAAEPAEQDAVGLAQEIEDDAPAGSLAGGAGRRGRHQVAHRPPAAPGAASGLIDSAYTHPRSRQAWATRPIEMT